MIPNAVDALRRSIDQQGVKPSDAITETFIRFCEPGPPDTPNNAALWDALYEASGLKQYLPHDPTRS